MTIFEPSDVPLGASPLPLRLICGSEDLASCEATKVSEENPGRWLVKLPSHATCGQCSGDVCPGERLRLVACGLHFEVSYSRHEARHGSRCASVRQRKARKRECNFEKIRRRFFFGHVFVVQRQEGPGRRYMVHHELGHGRSKVTFAVMCLDGGYETCAAKVVFKSDRGDLDSELSVHTAVMGAAVDCGDDYDSIPPFLPEIREYGDVDGGDFSVLIVESGIPVPHGLSDRRLHFISWAMAVAVHQLNRAGYVHCDIKPSNFVLINGIWPVMCDLGSATTSSRKSLGCDDRVPLREYTRGYLDPSVDLSLRPPDTSIRLDMYSWAQTVRRMASSTASMGMDLEAAVLKCESTSMDERPQSFRDIAELISPSDDCIPWGRTFRSGTRAVRP